MGTGENQVKQQAAEFSKCTWGFLKVFSRTSWLQTAIFAEIMGFIVAVELAELKGWFLLWIESDSIILVNKLISMSNDVPWIVRVRWGKFLDTLGSKNF